MPGSLCLSNKINKINDALFNTEWSNFLIWPLRMLTRQKKIPNTWFWDYSLKGCMAFLGVMFIDLALLITIPSFFLVNMECVMNIKIMGNNIFYVGFLVEERSQTYGKQIKFYRIWFHQVLFLENLMLIFFVSSRVTFIDMIGNNCSLIFWWQKEYDYAPGLQVLPEWSDAFRCSCSSVCSIWFYQLCYPYNKTAH